MSLVEDVLNGIEQSEPQIRYNVDEDDMQKLLDEFCLRHDLVGKLSIDNDDNTASRPVLVWYIDSQSELAKALDLELDEAGKINDDASYLLDQVLSDVLNSSITVEAYVNSYVSYDLVSPYPRR